MSSRYTSRAALGFALVLLASAPRPARAEMNASVRQQLIDARERALSERKGSPAPAPSVEPKFGTDSFDTLNVHAYAFQANTSSDLILDDGNGYRYFGAPSVPYMAANVQIPAGALLGYIALSSCSAHDGDLVAGLFDNGVDGSGSGGGTLLASVTSHAGCFRAEVLVTSGGIYGAVADHPLYLVVFFAGNAFDGTTKFNNVDLGIKRNISPAPATATFNDVPVSDPAFQFVEALANSSITAGCTAASYCPDNFVTRRQMAVFLSKALGLHWPF